MVLASVVSERVAHITQLCVAPEQQGRGLGRRLIEHAVGILRREGFQGATLTVTVANSRAIQLYRSLGFSTLNNFPAFAWDGPAKKARLTSAWTASRS